MAPPTRPRALIVMVALACLAAIVAPVDTLRAQAPASASPATAEGIRLFEAGKNDEARVQLTPPATAAKPDPVAMFYLGRLDMRRERWKEAADWFEKAVKLDDANSAYHDWLGRAYGRQAQKSSKLKQPFLAGKVRKEFERAVELDPRNLDARESLMEFYMVAPGMMGGSAEKARGQAAEIGKIDAFRGHIASARVAQDAKDFPAAEKAYQAAIAAAPDSVRAHLALGIFYTRGERWDDAFKTFDSMLARWPDQAAAHYQIGRTGAMSGQQLDKAAAALERFLTLPSDPLAPDAASAHWRLGMVREKSGDKERARSEYEKALALRPDFPDAKKSLAKLK